MNYRKVLPNFKTMNRPEATYSFSKRIGKQAELCITHFTGISKNNDVVDRSMCVRRLSLHNFSCGRKLFLRRSPAAALEEQFSNWKWG